MATILSSFIGSCIQKIQGIATEEAVLILGVKEELTDLQRRMKQIQCFISDAEQRSIKESAVNNWLGELRDAMYDADICQKKKKMYDADNIIDLARFKGNKLLADHPSSSSRQLTVWRGCSPLSCIANIQTRREIAVQIRILNKRIERISKDGMFLTLNATPPTRKASVPDWRKTSALTEPNIVGKEINYSSRKLVDLVLAHKENKAYRYAITGIGGVGKTTLAQKIYNDQKIKGNFNKHGWICVSQTYNEIDLLKEVLRNIGVHQEQGETVAELKGKLAEAIEDKSFFLVLDDVWQSSVWTNLLKIALHSATTVVILITTRDDTVAMEVGTEHTHRVDVLSVEVAWELLWRSMNVDEEKEVQNLKGIGTEIVRKCGCLPLAIKVTASVLASRDQTENEWNKILTKISRPRRKLPDDIEIALCISYDELPHHLKQCFIYCAMFREDYPIYLYDAIRLWVAEGFVEEQPGQLLEETAEEYYYELIHRNLLQPNTTYFFPIVCKMHDLLRQLACYLSKEECFIGDPESLRGKSMSRLWRISVVTKKDFVVFPTMDKERFRVRTFTFRSVHQGIDTSFFKKFLYLRVLDLTDSSIQTIPGYIGNLIHLRLLDLDGTEISCLPECISSLINLQVLNLQWCKALHSLPSALTQLCNLRRLGLHGTPINQVPKDIGRLEFLNDLEGFPVGGGGDNSKTQDGWRLEELEHLSQLWRLNLIKLENATPCNTHSLLTNKRHLKELNLRCTKRTDEPYSDEDVSNIEKIFEQLIPPQNLEDLQINEFFGRRFPSWIGTTHLSSIKILALAECKSCVHLPSIGQLPNLRYLRIDGATAVTKIGPEFVGCRGPNPRSTGVVVAFPKLEMLYIRDMPNWEEWSFAEEEDAAAAVATDGRDRSAEIQKEEAPSPRMQMLTRLKNLVIDGCPKLRALPRQLGQEATSLKVLYIARSRCLNVVEDIPFLSEMLVIQNCDGLERVSNLPQVRSLRINDCPGLRCVEGLGSLQQLWLAKDMKELSSLWIPGLQQQHLKLYGEDMDVYTWT